MKRKRSRELIEEVVTSGVGVISTQVMQEFYVAATRNTGVAPLAAKAMIYSEDLNAGQLIDGVKIANPFV